MADQPITGLPTKTASGVASTDKMLGIDSAEGYQILVRDVAKYIIENCDVSTLAGAVQTPKAAIDLLNNNGLYDRGGLRGNVDLNDLKAPGLYYCAANSGSNFPTGLTYNGVLIEVSLFANSGGVCQVCIDAVGASKRIWRRYFVNSAWSAWVQQPERQEITDLNSNTLQKVVNDVAASVLTKASNWNTLPLGFYGFNLYISVDSTGEGYPSPDTLGILIHIQLAHNSFMQCILGQEYLATRFRTSTTAAWTAWKKVTISA